MKTVTNAPSFSFHTFYEEVGRFLQFTALFWIRPIDYVVERSIHNFTTAVLPGKFGNQPAIFAEIALRITTVSLSILTLPITLTCYAIGQVLDFLGNQLHKKPYYYLKGDLKEKTGLLKEKSMTIFSANLCMLPMGIFILGGIKPPSERMDIAALSIVTADSDFVCLQEISFSSSLALWDKIKGSYAHGFTRIGPMPVSRMEGALFFASKYPVEGVRYYKLPYTGAIVRGIFCVKTEKGWIINGHLSAGSEMKEERALQIQKIVSLSEELSLGGKIPCFLCLDSNIERTGKEGDEYSFSKVSDHFTKGLVEEPFILTKENATCTNCLTAAIQGKKDPEKIEEAFEYIDFTLAYKSALQDIKILTEKRLGYDLNHKEEALSDHHILVSKILF